MKILFQATGFNPGKRLIDLAHKKVEALDKFHDGIVEANIHLRKIRSARPDNNACELRIAIPGNDPYVSKRGFTFGEAITNAVEAMKRKLKIRNAKLKSKVVA